MPKLVTGMQNKDGFSLLEILVVLVIIAITLSFALLAFGDFGGKRRIVASAEQFANYIELAKQQAILESGTLGIRFNKNTYQLLRFIPSQGWQALSGQRIFRPQNLPEDAVINLERESQAQRGAEIIINSSGDITPFKLFFRGKDREAVIIVTGSHNGKVELQPAKKL